MLCTDTWQAMGNWHYKQTISLCSVEAESKHHCPVVVVFLGPVAQIPQRYLPSGKRVFCPLRVTWNKKIRACREDLGKYTADFHLMLLSDPLFSQARLCSVLGEGWDTWVRGKYLTGRVCLPLGSHMCRRLTWASVTLAKAQEQSCVPVPEKNPAYSCRKISFSWELKFWCEVWPDELLNCDAVNPRENLCFYVLANTDTAQQQLDYLSLLLLNLREQAFQVLLFKRVGSPCCLPS